MRAGLRIVPSISFSFASVLLAVACPSRAAGPSKAECLAASEAWLALRKGELLREARAELVACAAESCPAEVRDECARHVAELNAAIPTVVFAAQDAVAGDVSAVKVAVDGRPFVDRLDGRAIEIDPGPHTFTFEMSGRAPVERRFVIHEGEKDRRETIVFATAPVEMLPVGRRQPPSAAPTHAVEGARAGSRRSTVPFVLAGFGVAGVLAGALAGLKASSAWSRAKSDCGAGCGPDSPAQDEKAQAQAYATAATVGFAVGGAALGAAAVWWLAEPQAAPEGRASGASVRLAPRLGPGEVGATVRGRF